MPATRPHIDRDLKRGEILDAAEKLLLRDGFDATAMAAIAREAGVANNAVYWYFASKDDLLAAVLERRQKRALATIGEIETYSLEKRVLAFLTQLDQVSSLTAAVHARANHSSAVEKMHRAFHATAERYLKAAFLDAGMGQADAENATMATMAMVEGIHLHDANRDIAARNRLVVWTVTRLAGADPPLD